MQFKKASPVKDQVIFDFLSTNKSHSKARKKFKIGESRIQRIIRQLGQHQRRRRRRITQDHHNFIIDAALNGIISSTILLRKFKEAFPNVKISQSTIIRLLTENKFRFRKPRHIQLLTNAHKFNRYNFSINMLTYHRNSFSKIVFSDECRFCKLPDNSMRWIRSNDFREEKCAKYSKFTFGTMAWGAIGLNFKSKLIFPRGKIDAENYRHMLDESQIFKDADEKLGQFNYIFQQDGASAHTTQESYEHIEKDALILYGWPANSPDLSPIEMIWSIMKNKLASREVQPENQEELEEILLDIWDNEIEQDLINDLVMSFEYRLEMCRDVYGGSISHFLSAGRRRIYETDLIDKSYIPHLLTDDDVKILLNMNLKKHHRWKSDIIFIFVFR